MHASCGCISSGNAMPSFRNVSVVFLSCRTTSQVSRHIAMIFLRTASALSEAQTWTSSAMTPSSAFVQAPPRYPSEIICASSITAQE